MKYTIYNNKNNEIIWKDLTFEELLENITAIYNTIGLNIVITKRVKTNIYVDIVKIHYNEYGKAESYIIG